MVELAERIAALSGIPDARVFFTTSGTEANDTALLLATELPRGPTRSWRCATATTAVRSRRSPSPATARWSPTVSRPLADAVRARRRTATAARYADLPDDAVHRGLRRRPARTCSATRRRRRGRADRRAHPGRRRLHLPAGRAASPRSRRCSTGTASCGSPTRCRPAGAAPATTSGAGRRTPATARRTSSPSPRASATACRIGGVVARAEIMDCLDANSISTFGGTPDHHRRRAWPTSRTCSSTTSRATPRGSAARCSSGCGAVGAARTARRRGARQGPDDRRRAGQAGHRRAATPAAATAVLEAARKRGPADRQGRRCYGKRAAHRPAAVAHRRGGRGGRRRSSNGPCAAYQSDRRSSA